MKYNFSKYQGLGNDFIIFDARGNNLDNLFTDNKDNFIEKLCNRNFGIGADGIILILGSRNNCFVINFIELFVICFKKIFVRNTIVIN